MITDRSQRWRNRRAYYVPASTIIDPRDYAVDVINSYKTAKPFIEQHHYSQSISAPRLSLGLFRNGAAGTSDLVGVCVFSVPVNNASVPKHTGLTDPNKGCDLGRFCLLDEVPGNGESRFLSLAMRLLRQQKPDILSIVSYADPMKRIGDDGQILAPGHVGQIYQHGAHYRGRTKPRTMFFTPDGQIFAERALSKIKGGETGQGYAVDELVRRGAKKPMTDDLRGWLSQLKDSGFLIPRRHEGNHIYNFPLTKAAKLAQRNLPSLPYPILDRSPQGLDVTALPLLAA